MLSRTWSRPAGRTTARAGAGGWWIGASRPGCLRWKPQRASLSGRAVCQMTRRALPLAALGRAAGGCRAGGTGRATSPRLAIAVLGGLASLTLACSGRPESGASGSTPAQDPQTREMQVRIESIVSRLPPGLDFLSEREDQGEVPDTDDPRQRLRFLAQRGRERLLAGDTESALVDLSAAAEQAGDLGDAERLLSLQRLLALANLRLGEQDNCLVGTAESCILPLRGHGVHAEQRGAARALPLLIELARQDPPEGSSRWLANLAAMALGDWPEALPEDLRFPATAFADASSFPFFPNRAGEAGADVLGLSGSVVADDLDGDRRIDLVVTSWGLLDPIRFFRNCGEFGLAFCEVSPETTGLGGLPGGLNLVHADYDNDGDADLFVLRGAWLGDAGQVPNSLLRNEGDWRFVDVTESAGLLYLVPSQTAAWSDLDRDGWLDLIVGVESPPGAEPVASKIYRNRGDGAFEEVGREAGLHAIGFVKAVTVGDVDDDGWPDIYLSRFGEPNQLWINRTGSSGDLGFEERSAAFGVGEPRWSFPAGFFDADGDGLQDLLVLPYAADFATAGIAPILAHELGLPHAGELPRLYLNQGGAGFLDVTSRFRLDRPLLAMGTNVGDLDGDGRLDLYVGTGAPGLDTLVPNVMLRATEGGVFEDVSFSGGFAHLQKGHGVAFADFDDDGDQDVYAVLGGAYSGDTARNALFENPGGESSWLRLRLVGMRSNRSAIGARVSVRWREGGADGAASVERLLSRVVGPGLSFGSSPLRVEIGLGRAASVGELVVDWPSPMDDRSGERLRQRFRDVQVDTAYELVEGGQLRRDGSD
ncbi:MAG: CRTAC1 family protein [Acidobacteria bacterium]|nr:MAG: CRTAC1 family protein [Acidobacteriota bacterium]